MLEILRRQDLTTAGQLAERLEVSERTVYRDIKDLMASGVPIEGEAGMGYVLESFDLPPLMFDRDEIEALTFGMRMVQTWGDSELAAAAERALDKIEVVLPEDRQSMIASTPLFAPGVYARLYGGPEVSFDIAGLRRAMRERRKITIAYIDAKDSPSERTLWPLGMTFFGQVWLMMAWCELRGAFRVFRPDRIQSLDVLESAFPEEPGKTLGDYMEQLRLECEAEKGEWG